MKEFSKYLKEARQEFCKEVNKYNVSDNLKLRTACDSFLIAFDQATEKAINYFKNASTTSPIVGDPIVTMVKEKFDLRPQYFCG